MTPQEKLAKAREIIEKYKKMLRTDLDILEATTYYSNNQDVYERMTKELEEVLKD